MNKCSIIFQLLLAILTISDLNASDLLGKVMIYEKDKSPPRINPIFDGDSINLNNKYIIKLAGVVVLAEPGTSIKAFRQSNYTIIYMSTGTSRFRIDPSKASLSFRTPYGEVFTPVVYPASGGVIDGAIMVKDTTILELNEGVMEARTVNGITKIESGQAVLITQAVIEKPDSVSVQPQEDDSITETKPMSDNNSETVAKSESDMPGKLIETLGLIGEVGTAETALNPTGEIDIAAAKDWDGKGQLVDYNLSVLKDVNIPQGTEVKIVCVRVAKKDDSKLLVRPVDNFYPEHEDEKSLIDLSAEAQSDMQPEGFIKLKPGNDNDLKGRSLENWSAIVVENDMRPKGKAFILEDTDLKVVCLRTALLVKPSYLVNKEQLDLVGETALVVKEFNGRGKVNVDGKIYNAIPVDYNMQLKPEFSAPVDTELTVVGVRGSDFTLLVQYPGDVLGELKFVGTEVRALENFKPYGEVAIGDEGEESKWAAVVVTTDLIPFYGVEVEKDTKLTVIGVFTQLLVTESEILIGWYDPSIFSQVVSIASSPAGIGAAAGVGTVTVVPPDTILGGNDDDASPIE